MALEPGTRLGPYEILSPLGAGGMGEVYRARDTRLGRDVAIKVLPEHLSMDAKVRARFEREAKAISSLNHPHICTLYDVGREGETDFLVMEYLKGETLAFRLSRGLLSLPDVLRYGAEIAEALDTAHGQGIVHRDLKPGNVMLTGTGVKLLDFGLARTIAPPEPEALSSVVPTAAGPLTAQGVILGTVAYMAPEQVEGRQADALSDLFALGAILYEMATGKRAFPGTSQASLIAEILRSDPPPVSTLAPLSPPALDRVVRECLEKDPKRRWQSAGDLARELHWIAEAEEAAPANPSPTRHRYGRLAWGIAAVAILASTVAAVLVRRPYAHLEATRFKILAPPGQSFLGFAVLSPDARRILVLLRDDGGKNSLAVRSLDSLDVRSLPGTENARGAFWSPDSREIGFFSDGTLKRMSADGGGVRTVCESGAAVWGTWSPEGTILFSRQFGTPLFAVSAAGGAPRQLTVLHPAEGDLYHALPNFLPDGRHFIFHVFSADVSKRRTMLGSIDSNDVRTLFQSDSSAEYAEPGYLLFGRDDAVLAWRFDPRALKLVGDPFPAFENVQWTDTDEFLSLSAAGNRVAYLSMSLRRRLVWLDRKGRELGTLGEIGGYGDVRISPDGRKVAVTIRDPAHGRNGDIWILDAARGTGLRLTATRSDEFSPAWFPYGNRVAYVSDQSGFYGIVERPAGGGPQSVLIQAPYDNILPEILPGGRHALVGSLKTDKYCPQIVSLDDPKDSRRLDADARFSEEHSQISPDGRWTTFDSVESGQREVYLQQIPDGAKRQVSIGGGQMPVWNRNGRELFYASRDGTLMSVAMRAGSTRLEPADPQPMFPLQFDASGELSWQHFPYDVSPDGQRFLVIRRAPGVEQDGLVVVDNWTAGLKETR